MFLLAVWFHCSLMGSQVGWFRVSAWFLVQFLGGAPSLFKRWFLLHLYVWKRPIYDCYLALLCLPFTSSLETCWDRPCLQGRSVLVREAPVGTSSWVNELSSSMIWCSDRAFVAPTRYSSSSLATELVQSALSDLELYPRWADVQQRLFPGCSQLVRRDKAW
jgi:hypothetical protein